MRSGQTRPMASPAMSHSDEVPIIDSAATAGQLGRSVILTEADGLAALADSLDGAFTEAVDLIVGLKGRVVLTGMGKSGHIARKIAATLASTGTPALYVHPSEASHGDLGMIAPTDAVLALSNSGETAELSDTIQYCRRNGIPLIGITGGARSSLADTANIVLVLPPVREACAIGLAPTTSSTMMLALGDALAVTAMTRKGFTSQHFQAFHPGGRLGQALLRVSRIMHVGDEVPRVRPDAAMSDVLIEMTAKRFGCVGVLDGEGRLIGSITDGDLRRHMADGLLSRTAGDVMATAPKTAEPATLAVDVLAQMNRLKITSVFIVDPDHRPIGIVHVHDCLRLGVA